MLSHQGLTKIAEVYGLPVTLTSVTPISGGRQHHLYKVSSGAENYALKILNPELIKSEQFKKQLNRANIIAKHFLNQGITAVPAYEINQQAFIKIDGSYMQLFDWRQGKIIENDEITLINIYQVATLLVRLHTCNSESIEQTLGECYQLPIITIRQWQRTVKIAKRLQLIEFYNSWADDFLIYLYVNGVQACQCLTNERVLSHGDLDNYNILWSAQGDASLLDWEYSGWIHPSVDILATALDWAGLSTSRFNKQYFTTFLNIYKKHSKKFLQQIKLASQVVMGYWTCWLYDNIKRYSLASATHKQVIKKEIVITFNALLTINKINFSNTMGSYE